MNCAGIKGLLSEYIDGVLDAQTETVIKEHISTCADCHKEMEELKALIKDIGSFEQAMAPDDFLDRVHKRIESRFDFAKIIKTLFVPMRIKIPVQLVTATATAVLVFSIIQLPQPEKQVEEELLKDASTTSEKEEVKPELIKESAESLPGRKTYAPKTVSPKVKVYKKSKTKKATAISLNKPKSEKVVKLALVLKARPDQKPVVTITPIKAAPPAEDREMSDEEEKTDTRSSFRSRLAGKAAAKEDVVADAVKFDEKPETPSPAEPLAEKEMAGKSESDVDHISKKLKKIISDLKGEIKSIQYDSKTGHPIFLTAAIPANKYSDFYGRLREIGDFQGPLPAPEEKKDEKKKGMINIELVISK